MYRAVLARWRSNYKEADLLVSGLSGENIKKMLQRLKRDGDHFQKWLNDPSTAEHIADTLELHFLYPDRVLIFEDGSYAFVDQHGDLSGDRNVVYRPIDDDDDAEDERIMNLLKDKGILPPKEYGDVGAMLTYMGHFRRQKQAERDELQAKDREAIEQIKPELKEVKEQALLRLEEILSKASAPPDLNTIFGVKPSNLSRQASPHKVRNTK